MAKVNITTGQTLSTKQYTEQMRGPEIGKGEKGEGLNFMRGPASVSGIQN